MNVDTLLSLDASAQESFVKKSATLYSGTGLDLFASRKIGNSEVAGHYYGTLV